MVARKLGQAAVRNQLRYQLEFLATAREFRDYPASFLFERICHTSMHGPGSERTLDVSTAVVGLLT